MSCPCRTLRVSPARVCFIGPQCPRHRRDLRDRTRHHRSAVGGDRAVHAATGGLGAGDRRAQEPRVWNRGTRIVERFGRLAEAGARHVMVNFRDADDVALIEALGSRVIPQLRRIDATTPQPGAALNL